MKRNARYSDRHRLSGLLIFSTAVALLILPIMSPAQEGAERWVTDRLEITMRTGKDNRQSIVRMLRSGTRVEVLEVDNDAGYSRVRTSSGVEGWVLTRFLLREPVARERLPDTERRLRESEAARQTLQAELRELQQEKGRVDRLLEEMQSNENSLERELGRITELSSDTIRVDEANRRLKQRVIDTEREIGQLTTENQNLASRSSREWFIVGAAVLTVGMLLGLIIPRLKWRRRSSWSNRL